MMTLFIVTQVSNDFQYQILFQNEYPIVFSLIRHDLYHFSDFLLNYPITENNSSGAWVDLHVEEGESELGLCLTWLL